MDDIDDVDAKLRELCNELGFQCIINVLPRDALNDIPSGLDIILTYAGAGTPPTGWAVLRAEVEDAMERRGLETMRWLSMSGPLSGKPAHCIAVAMAR